MIRFGSGMSRLIPIFLIAFAAFAQDPIRVLLVTGGHDHDLSFYSVLDDKRLKVNVNPHPLAFKNDMRKRYDVIVLYDLMQDMEEAKKANLRAFVEDGKGIVVLHHAICGNGDWKWWSEEVVGARYKLAINHDLPASTYKHDEVINVKVVKKHPVTEGVTDFTFNDETYKGMWFSPKVTPLLTTDSPTSDPVIGLLGIHPKARVVFLQSGHGPEAHHNENYRRLVRNAVVWAAKGE